ncbi:MAG: low affinity iron permease family protein [Candidatus Eremiobacteraeota bacterium]|nr:low affinity iron permease family protein [Candidatus Eremiobacteraeota bacterium]
MLKTWLSGFAASVYRATSTPVATGLAFGIVVAWMLAGRRMHYNSTWILLMSAISAVVTLVMVFVLNHAQSRDTAAINAKLDALIFAVEHADNRLIGMERLTTDEVERIHEEIVGPLHEEAVQAVAEEAIRAAGRPLE